LSGYRLSNKAEADLEGILVYTVDMWGAEQADRYLSALGDCFDLIALQPFAAICIFFKIRKREER